MRILLNTISNKFQGFKVTRVHKNKKYQSNLNQSTVSSEALSDLIESESTVLLQGDVDSNKFKTPSKHQNLCFDINYYYNAVEKQIIYTESITKKNPKDLIQEKEQKKPYELQIALFQSDINSNKFITQPTRIKSTLLKSKRGKVNLKEDQYCTPNKTNKTLPLYDQKTTTQEGNLYNQSIKSFKLIPNKRNVHNLTELPNKVNQENILSHFKVFENELQQQNLIKEVSIQDLKLRHKLERKTLIKKLSEKYGLSIKILPKNKINEEIKEEFTQDLKAIANNNLNYNESYTTQSDLLSTQIFDTKNVNIIRYKKSNSIFFKNEIESYDDNIIDTNNIDINNDDYDYHQFTVDDINK